MGQNTGLPKYYYTDVAKVGTGTTEDPFRPDLPEGTDGVFFEYTEGLFFVMVYKKLPTGFPLKTKDMTADLQAYLNQIGLKSEDVAKWKAGE